MGQQGYENHDELKEEICSKPTGLIVVSEIEPMVYKQFQEAAFNHYKEAVITYGRRVWTEARSIAHQRDPDANIIEITTPDVEAAAFRVDMKLARLRQLRFPFSLVKQILMLITGIVAKYFFDIANLPQGNSRKAWLPWSEIGFLACIMVIIVLFYFETRAELLR